MEDRQIAGWLEARRRLSATPWPRCVSAPRPRAGRQLSAPAESPFAPNAPSERDSVPADSYLDAVACTPTDYCVALGTYASPDDVLQTMVATYGSPGP